MKARKTERSSTSWFQYRKRYGLHAMKIEIINTTPHDSFNTASGMDCMQCSLCPIHTRISLCFNTASGMDCMQLVMESIGADTTNGFNTASGMDCMQSSMKSTFSRLRVSFNTASGMDCMQFLRSLFRIEIPMRFNTASGMDCMQYVSRASRLRRRVVSIPQAVWIACNTINRCGTQSIHSFQYRKRYGLHAILSPGSLGNSEPKNRVSNDDPLFAFFPKVSGTFLSRKVLRKGLEASHSKGTFVHERNLILMAFSLNFRASSEQSIP